jgi:hypothetical protein
MEPMVVYTKRYLDDQLPRHQNAGDLHAADLMGYRPVGIGCKRRRRPMGPKRYSWPVQLLLCNMAVETGFARMRDCEPQELGMALSRHKFLAAAPQAIGDTRTGELIQCSQALFF